MSGAAAGLQIDLDAIVDRGTTGDAGVPHGRLLLAYAVAVNGPTRDLADARTDLVEALGEQALREAAATIAIFNGLVRVADGTGIQLDEGLLAASAVERARLGLDRFTGAENTADEPPPADATPSSIPSVRDLFA